MNAITTFDSFMNDIESFFAADAKTQARVMKEWEAKDAAYAATFADKVHSFIQDAQVGYAFLTPQLHRIETQVYMRKYPSFDLTGIIDINEDGDMWDVGTVFYSMDTAGRAEFLAGNSFDMPYAGTSMDQFTRGFHLAGIGYEWNIQEMNRAAKLGRSLSADKAMAADKSAQAFKRSIAMTGRAPGTAASEKGWTGLINNGSVTAANVAADGTGSTTTWSTKTPDQISRDIWAAVNAVETATGETHVANTVLLPTAKLRYIEQTRMTDGSGTILEYIRGARDGGENIRFVPVRELAGAGASSTDRMVALDNTREVAQFHLPGDHEFLPPYQKSEMVYSVGGILNVGGTEIRLPKAIQYRDGI
ncbi:MAG: major capsid family protein [Blastomonas sp.]